MEHGPVTDETIVCPYCGAEYVSHTLDLCDTYDDWDGDLDCGNCGKTFRCVCEVSVSYTTSPLN